MAIASALLFDESAVCESQAYPVLKTPVTTTVTVSRPVEPTATEAYKDKSRIAYELSKLPLKASRPLKVIVVGAGISALSLAHDVSVGRIENIELHILEKNSGLGGTWFENRYPGCACDVPSHNYLVSTMHSQKVILRHARTA